VSEVSEYITRPVIVGGGIVSPDEANRKVLAGASFVVVGTHFESEQSSALISEFADAIHVRTTSEVLP
jgi:heptaprenylglyceryl phosphate synthase